MVTLRYVDLLLTILTACAVGATVALVVGINRLRTTLARVDEFLLRAGVLLPEIDRLSVEAEQTLRSVRRLGDRAEGIAEDVGSMAARARAATLPLLQELAAQGDLAAAALRQLAALLAGAKAGLGALSRSGSR